VLDPTANTIRTFAYVVSPTAGPEEPLPDGITVRRGNAADVAVLESHLAAEGQLVTLRADDLYPDGISLAEVGKEYAALGLHRSRELYVAERRGMPCGFLLLETSSLGLNLSELTNAFQLHLLEPDARVVEALAITARRRYRELGRSFCIGLAPREWGATFKAMGFTWTKDYSLWTVHRSLFRRYYEYVSRMYQSSDPL
jgi:hypothetical protein